MHRVEELVVDAPVDHVHRPGAAHRAHPEPVVAAEQVAPLDQLGAHATGEEGVLEVRGVVDPRGEHGDGRVGHVRRRRRAQGVEQPFGVLGHGQHLGAGEDLGQHVGQRPAVLQHVGDPAGAAQVVLEHPEGAVLVAHEVDTGDVDPHPVRRHQPCGRAVEVRRGGHQPPGHHSFVEDLPGSVDVGEEELQGPDALAHPRLDLAPLVGADDAGHQVEGQGPFAACEREGDPQPVEVGVPQAGPLGEALGAEGVQHVGHVRESRPRSAVVAEHLVEHGGAPRGRAGAGAHRSSVLAACVAGE